MNPLLAGAGAKALNEIDFNKVLSVIGSVILIIVVVVIIRKNTKKSKTEAQQDSYLDSVARDIIASNLSYEKSWYDGMAITLAEALDASFGQNGGWLGCDQDRIYSIMEEMQNNDDVKLLEASFGTRELNASWLSKKKAMTLKQAVQKLMTNKEHDKVNEILKEKGITYLL